MPGVQSLRACIMFALLLASNVRGELSPEAVTTAMRVLATSGYCRGDRPIYRLLEDDDCNSLVVIDVENWTRYPLVKPSVRMVGKSGRLVYIPRDVLPGNKDTMMPCEYRLDKYIGGTLVAEPGTSGTVSWEILGLGRRVYVMWALTLKPRQINYIRPHLTNWLAIGLSAEGHVIDPAGYVTYLAMFHLNSTDELGFERRRFDGGTDIEPFAYENNGIQVEGMMGTGSKTEVRVTIRPTSEEYLAESIRSEMSASHVTGSSNNGRSQASTLSGSAVLPSVTGQWVLLAFVMLTFLLVV